MKKFRFPLEKLLEWRKTQLEQEEQRLELALYGQHQLESQRELLLSEAAGQSDRLRHAPAVDSTELAMLPAYNGWVRRRSRQFGEAIQQAAAKVAEQRLTVLEARRKYELLVKLRDKRLTQWTAEADKEIEDMVAELTVARWRAPQP